MAAELQAGRSTAGRCRARNGYNLLPIIKARATKMERNIADLWKEVMSLQQIGLYDNFFDLGGHSLMAVRIASRIRASVGVELPVRSIFEKPTVAELAAHVDSLSSAGQPQASPPEDSEVAVDGNSMHLHELLLHLEKMPEVICDGDSALHLWDPLPSARRPVLEEASQDDRFSRLRIAWPNCSGRRRRMLRSRCRRRRRVHRKIGDGPSAWGGGGPTAFAEERRCAGCGVTSSGSQVPPRIFRKEHSLSGKDALNG